MKETKLPRSTPLKKYASLLTLARRLPMYVGPLAISFFLMNLAMAAQPLVPPSPTPTPSAARRGELISLVRQDCGSCHGMTLKGGLGPALLPETLKDKPPESLQATILHGRPGTAMPPWQRFLTEAETSWIVAQLQKGFPDEK